MLNARATDWQTIARDLATQGPERGFWSWAFPYLSDMFPDYTVKAIEVSTNTSPENDNVYVTVVMGSQVDKFALKGVGKNRALALVNAVYDGEPIPSEL